MLADTAKTTLREQVAADSKRNFHNIAQGDHAAKTAYDSTPEQMFGEENTSKWASLAFSK